MLAHLRTAVPRRTASPWAVSTCSVSRSRTINISASRAEEDEDEDDDERKGKRSGPRDPPFEQWLNTTGSTYKDPVRPRNWLGGKVVEFVFTDSADLSRLPGDVWAAFPSEPVFQATYTRLRSSPYRHLQRVHDQPRAIQCSGAVGAAWRQHTTC